MRLLRGTTARMKVVLGACSLYVGGGSCMACTETPPQAALGPDVVAGVGALAVTRGMVQLFDAHGEELIDGLVRDTLFAQESAATAGDRASVIERGVLSRALVETMRDRALQAAPPTEEESKQIVAEQWLRFDRPRAVRTVAIRVPVPEMADDALYQAAAEKLRQASLGTLNLETLLERTQAVEVQVEVQRVRMPPVAADGKVVPEDAMDHDLTQVEREFAEQANLLSAPADITPVFALKDAFQFLFATEIIEPFKMDAAEQRREVQLRVGQSRISPQLAEIVAAGKARLEWSTKDVPALLKRVWRE